MLQPRSKWKANHEAGVILHALILFCCLFAINVYLQIANSSYESDFGAHPDEGAHVVTALMVRDYLAGGFLESANPISYAKSYYEVFPKVAIGHYPPVFYLIAGGWLLFGVTVHNLLVFSAIITSLCGLITFLLGRLFIGRVWAIGAALMFTLSPITQRYTSVFMSDMMLLAGCLLSAAAFLRFMQHGRRVDSMLFGVIASATILTKSSGLLLAVVPFFALLLSCRIHLIRASAIWIAPVVVLITAVPWLVFTYPITSEGAMSDSVPDYLEKSLPFFSAAIVDVSGVLVVVLACGQILYRIIDAIFRRRAVSDSEAVMIALAIAGFCFYLFIPAGLEQRYLLVIMPAFYLLAFKAFQDICLRLVQALGLKSRCGLLLHLSAVIVLSFCVLLECFELRHKQAEGFAEIISAVGNSSGGINHSLLVVSDSRGEGAIIAASALASCRRPCEGIRVYRGSKTLASSDWLGRNYSAIYNTVAGVRAYMNSGALQFLALDEGVPPEKRAGYYGLVERAVNENSGDFMEVGRFPTLRRGGKKSDVILYRLAGEGAG